VDSLPWISALTTNRTAKRRSINRGDHAFFLSHSGNFPPAFTLRIWVRENPHLD
jgi:hypothetical protein